MNITILCSSETHPINAHLVRWIEHNAAEHDITIARHVQQLLGGDLLFLISCNEIVAASILRQYKKSLVIHASDLPQGRGWSPHVWQILEGKSLIKVTLLEAADKVDSGDIWHQVDCEIPRSATWDEINHALFEAELELMDYAATHFDTCRPRKQDPTVAPTYYERRRPSDSEIDPTLSIEAQFDRIRVADPVRFPAFFRLHGATYRIHLERIDS